MGDYCDYIQRKQKPVIKKEQNLLSSHVFCQKEFVNVSHNE